MADEQKPGADEEGAAPAPPAKAGNPWLPVVAAVVLAPGVSFALTQYLLIPKIKGAVAAKEEANAAVSGGDKAAGSKDATPEAKPGFSYDFTGVVVNLSGSMGTRYLKVSFTAFSSNQDLQKIITDNKQQLLDVAINTLSSHTLADLEVAGAKNMVRNDLIANFNQALNSDVISQLYFSEFVVQ